jgi:hypothetical protein
MRWADSWGLRFERPSRAQIGVLDNKCVSSAVSNALILRYLTIAFSSECQNHANFFSLFGRRVRDRQKSYGNFREFFRFNGDLRDTQYRSHFGQ